MPSSDPDLASAVIVWYRANKRDLPWRRDGFTPWGTLVSEFMLQQTPVNRVIPRLEEWMARWPTPADLAAVPAGEAVRAWSSLGYPRRALWLHACAVAIVERFDGAVPDRLDELLSLPGVGDYTARAVLVFAYGMREAVVDTNVRRVLARAIDGVGSPGSVSTRRELATMTALLPRERAASAEFNAGMMELGAVVCQSRSPRCAVCPVREHCAWKEAGYPEFTGTRASRQKPYEGSDRQVRGLILAELRASQVPVTPEEIRVLWSIDSQRDRALAGLVADGLAVVAPGGYELP